LDKPYRAAVEQGLAYTRIGNPIGSAEIDRSSSPERRKDPLMRPVIHHPTPGEAFRRRLGDVMALDLTPPAIEFGSRWYTWGARRHGRRRRSCVRDAVRQARGEQVGVLLRSRPASIGCCSVSCAGGCVVVLNPQIGAQRLRDDLAALDLRVVTGEAADLDELVSTTEQSGVARSPSPTSVRPTSGSARAAPRSPPPATGDLIRLLTSGTTGPRSEAT
jgi:hypothetical protein